MDLLAGLKDYCFLYSSVVDLYFKEKGATVTDEMYQEYVRLVKVQKEMKTEAG